MKKKYGILIIFAILMLLSAINIGNWMNENKKAKKIVEKVENNIKKDNNRQYLDSSIKKENNETVGWIKVEGTNINYPVVQSKDNEFYLTHDFKKENNSTGWIFMDYQNRWSDQNIVIYGHHRRDGSMFGSIDNLFQNNDTNIEISFLTMEKEIKYQVFSIYKISSKDNYIDRNFNNIEETIKKYANRSEKKYEEIPSKTSQIITLSTCHNNNIDRLVVHGYKKETVS